MDVPGLEEVLLGSGSSDAGRGEEVAGREEPAHEGLGRSRLNEGFEWSSDMIAGREGQVGGSAAVQVTGENLGLCLGVTWWHTVGVRLQGRAAPS